MPDFRRKWHGPALTPLLAWTILPDDAAFHRERPMSSIRILVTGGTFDKESEEIET